VQTFYNFFLLS